ncbi:MAG TPA: MogA/MoaB family molybdenum cofactor biosynthesis protein [Vicinamibacterales bacterium]|nr:MogA/MoaB family molybdenum cofactor biosynthesis protein [Vicinamibacterales bacterium]
MSVQEHKAQLPTGIPCFVLTVSDTRTRETDTSGQTIAGHLERAGHRVVGRAVVRDEPAEVARLVRGHVDAAEVRAIVTTGGTGLSRRDTTYEALSAMFDKRIDGFGELFRVLSFDSIGPAAMLSRATAGIVGRTVIFMLPGSEQAVGLAMEKLVVPELAHIVRELDKHVA